MTRYAWLTRFVLAPALDAVRRRHTMRCLRELEGSQWWPIERIQQLQSERLQRLIRYAYENVPYYRSLMDSRGVSPERIRTAADLSLLPVLTKADSRRHFRELLSDGFPRRELVKGRTGGSTGEPFEFYSSREARLSHGIARGLRALEWAGIYPGDPSISVIRRRYTDSFWSAQLRRITGLLSRRSLEDCAGFSNSSLPFVIERIARSRPRLLSGYPSSMCIIAEFIRDSGLAAPRVDVVVTGGETLFDEQRALLREVFGTEPFSKYSSYENYDIAMECSAHSGLHVAAEDLVVEIVDDAGMPVQQGQRGRVVITSLHEYGMPLIRYDTDDDSAFIEGMCECGRVLPRLLPVMGKSGDTIYTRDGKRLSPRSFVAQGLANLGVRRFQVIQDRIDHVTVNVVPKGNLSPSDARQLANSVRSHYSGTLGADVELEVAVVDHIEPTPAGKHLFVISKVKRPSC